MAVARSNQLFSRHRNETSKAHKTARLAGSDRNNQFFDRLREPCPEALHSRLAVTLREKFFNYCVYHAPAILVAQLKSVNVRM
jgi:hypothetical protein